MTQELLLQNWALVIASVLGTGIVLFVIYRIYRDSTRGRLRTAVTYLRDRERAAQSAARDVDKAMARLERLRAKADSVVPKQADAARDATMEAQELQKLINDQLQIAQNDVRVLIVEEYPPRRHAAMRQKYLGEHT